MITDQKGEKNPNWKGGKPHCLFCGKSLSDHRARYCRQHKILTIEHKRKLRETKMGSKNPQWKGGKPQCPTCNKFLSGRDKQYCRNHRPITLEHRKKIGNGNRGANGGGWRGGITPINQTIRNSLEYKLWRITIFIRDNRTCIWCGSKENIEADHIKPFCLYPELRFAIDNGRTLCHECHKKTNTYGNVNHKQ